MSDDSDLDDSLREFTADSRKRYEERGKGSQSQTSQSQQKLSDQEIRRKLCFSEKEVDQFKEQLEKSTNQFYRRRDGKSKFDLKNESRTSRNTRIHFRHVRLECIYAKEPVPLPLSEMKRKTYTSSLGCNGQVKFKLSEDGSCYCVSEIVPHDKHPQINTATSKLLPQARKLNVDQKKLVKESLIVGGNKLKLVTKLNEEGTKVTLRDIHNVRAEMSKDRLGNSVSAITDVLKQFHADYEFHVNQHNEFQVLYIASPNMNVVFESWPEFIMTDTTYSLINLNFPVILINVVDGNGATEIVAVCILKTESEENLKWFFEVFKKKHESVIGKMKSCMTDKDGSIRKVCSEVFPVVMLICTYAHCNLHTAKIFKDKMVCESMDISKTERDNILSILQKMIYASDEKVYLEYYEELLQTKKTKVITYFDDNWHGIRQQWVRCFMISYNFLNNTNNRTESINNKIKLFCQKHNFLADFLLEFLQFFVYVFENERNVKALQNFTKVPAYVLSSDLQKYYSFVTKYAFDFIEKQNANVCYVKHCTMTSNSILVVYNALDVVKYTVTSKSCSCKSFVSMGLPCKHIFKCRTMLNVSLYDEDLVNERWTKKYFLSHYRLFQSIELPIVKSAVVTNKDVSRKCISLKLKDCGSTKEKPSGSNNSKDTDDKIGLDLCIENRVSADALKTGESISDVTSSTTDYAMQTSVNVSETNMQITDSINSRSSLRNCNVKDKISELPNDSCDCVNLKTTVIVHEECLEKCNEYVVKSADASNSACTVDDSKSVSKTNVHNADEAVTSSTSELKTNPKSTHFVSPLKCIENISNANVDNHTIGNVSDIIISKNERKRGRPKKKALTAIGLPNKKSKQVNCKSYLDLSDKEKAMIIFQWIVSPPIFKKIDISVVKIDVDTLKLKNLPCWLYNEEIDITVLQSYMTNEAFNLLQNAITANIEKVKWICFLCKKDLDESQRKDRQPSKSTNCDHCLKWYHYECLKVPPLDDNSTYFCDKCRNL